MFKVKLDTRNLKFRLLQVTLFALGTLLIVDRTLRSSSEFPPQIVILNMAEVICAFILFLIAISIET